MSAPPEAEVEYSRGQEPPRRRLIGRIARAAGRNSTVEPGSDRPASGPFSDRFTGRAILAGGLLGAALLAVAEFTTLFEVHATTSAAPVKTVTTGAQHAYALLPIAALAATLAIGVWRERSRIAFTAIGVLGVIALLIALLGDLPDAQATGLIGTSAGHYGIASSSPGPGLYLETLGAVVLVITCVSGFVLIGPPRPPARRSREPREPREPRERSAS
jgi:hypothetical protein